jgi:hypothetical protein
MNEPSHIHVSGRRWLDKKNGNTYHTVRVWVDGQFAVEHGMTFGYDNQYLETAHDALAANDLLPVEYYSNGVRKTLARTCEDRNIRLSYDCADVGRKRDLHKELGIF